MYYGKETIADNRSNAAQDGGKVMLINDGYCPWANKEEDQVGEEKKLEFRPKSLPTPDHSKRNNHSTQTSHEGDSEGEKRTRTS